MESTQLREELSQVLGASDQIQNLADSEKRELTEPEYNERTELLTRASQLKKLIEQNMREDDLRNWADKPSAPAEVPGSQNLSEPQKFRSLGEMLRCAMRAEIPGQVLDKRLTRAAASGMSESIPSDGGFLVQNDFASGLLQRAYETGVVASRTTKIQLSSNSNSIKIPAIDESSRADGSRMGGVRAYWKDEADLKTKSKPKIRNIELSLKKLVGLCYTTDELLQDAGALEAVIRKGFADEFGFKLDDAVVNGTGAGQPLGYMNSPCLTTQAAEGGQDPATVVYENIVNMWSRLWAPSRGNAVWFISQDIEPQLNTMSLAVGTGGSAVYLPPGGASATPYASLYGRPVIPIEQAQTLGTTGDIALCDMSEYIMIEKGGLQSDYSMHVRFLWDEGVFRFVLRTDGQPGWNSELTPYNGGATQSPFVVLATRS